MSALAHEFYASSGMMWLPIAALGLFIAVFLSQALRVLLQRSKSTDDHVAALPLDDGMTVAAGRRSSDEQGTRADRAGTPAGATQPAAEPIVAPQQGGRHA